MLSLLIGKKRREPLRILCLGAHSDDIEIGCGGTVLKIIETQRKVEFQWVVFSGTPEREKEARKSAEAFLDGAPGSLVTVEKFRDGFFPYVGGEIKEYFERLKTQVSPDVVFTHYHSDLHQDHRLVSELAYNTFRDHLVLEYEIPKYDGDLGTPNVYIPLERKTCLEKVRNINKYFKSQNTNHWFNEDLFYSILRIRGIECNASGRFAEAFHCRKLIIA
jgi:LmbE family N-acetylglucosaminyl deacetylase